MSDDDQPRRLNEDAESPEELVRALDAIARQDRDPARFERIAGKLEALLDAPPPPLAASGSWLLSAKTAIAVVGVGAAALLLWRQLSTPDEPPPQAAPPELAASQKAPEAGAPTPLAVDSSRVAPPREIEQHEPAALPSAQHAVRPRNRRSRELRDGRAPGASSEVAGAETQQPSAHAPSSSGAALPPTAAEPATQPAGDPASVAERSAEAPVAPPRPDEAVQERQQRSERAAAQDPPRQRSEAELLIGARQAMPQQPSAALRLLDEHATRFPSGMLAPEREVLAIEALYALKRTTDAEQRLQKFKARYPDSVHLRRLQLR